jgi:predicted membrane chloride channel (bestrophin family)
MPSDAEVRVSAEPRSEKLTHIPAQIAAEILNEEATLRFISFRTEDAVTIGMNLRKRFRSSAKHARGRGAVISVQVRSMFRELKTIVAHTRRSLSSFHFITCFFSHGLRAHPRSQPNDSH